MYTTQWSFGKDAAFVLCNITLGDNVLTVSVTACSVLRHCRRLGVSYVAATLGATGTALGLNSLVKVSSRCCLLAVQTCCCTIVDVMDDITYCMLFTD